MATSRLLSRFPASYTSHRSWSCSSRSQASKCTPKVSSSDSKNQNLKRHTGFTTANSTNRNTCFPVAAGVSHPVTSDGFVLVTLWDNAVDFVSSFGRKAAKTKLNPSLIQGFIERVVVDCRFFTFLAIAGSLLGSILCFVEGFIMVLRSYFRYFKHAHGSTVELLVEALDLFLVGTAMLIFGIGLHVMFLGSKHLIHKRQPRKSSQPNIFSLFNLEMLPSWLKMESTSEAKTGIGHAVLMILQVGMLEKFKSVPLVTGLDLALFAGAVLLSSASIFCLSKLSCSEAQEG